MGQDFLDIPYMMERYLSQVIEIHPVSELRKNKYINKISLSTYKSIYLFILLSIYLSIVSIYVNYKSKLIATEACYLSS